MSSAVRYLITFAIGLLLWVFIGVLFGEPIGGQVINILDVLVLSEWKRIFMILSGIGAAWGIIVTFIWYIYGGSPTRSGQDQKNGSMWTMLFILAVVGCAILTSISGWLFYDNPFRMMNVFMSFVFFSIHTWIFLWLNALFLSPIYVKYNVWLVS